MGIIHFGFFDIQQQFGRLGHIQVHYRDKKLFCWLQLHCCARLLLSLLKKGSPNWAVKYLGCGLYLMIPIFFVRRVLHFIPTTVSITLKKKNDSTSKSAVLNSYLPICIQIIKFIIAPGKSHLKCIIFLPKLFNCNLQKLLASFALVFPFLHLPCHLMSCCLICHSQTDSRLLSGKSQYYCKILSCINCD